MKRIIFGLSCLFLFLLPVYGYGAAGDAATVNGKSVADISTINGVAGASIATVCGKPYTDGDAACSYTQKDTQATGANGMVVGSTGTNLRVGNSFTSSSAYTLKKVALSLKIVGTGGFTTFTVNVCANSDTIPGSCTVIGTQTVADLTTDFVTHEYVYATGYAISNATNYWIVLIANAEGDASNHVAAARNGAGSMAQATYTGIEWNVTDATSDLVFTTYSCE
jgi:hypothetical protein